MLKLFANIFGVAVIVLRLMILAVKWSIGVPFSTASWVVHVLNGLYVL